MKKLTGIVKKAWEAVGGLSQPSKMPCFSYSIPAVKCNIGSKLRNVANSVCNKCYALKGFYVYPNAKNALQRRFESLSNPKWVEYMTLLIGSLESSGYFRFHDSGDVQDISHFEKICQIARNLPHIKFWLPSREIKIISEYVNSGKTIPENLVVRLSAYMIDGDAPISIANKLNVCTSTVTRSENFNCPASKQNNMCLNCRACWNREVKNIAYKAH